MATEKMTNCQVNTISTQTEAEHSRPLESVYPVLWVDALYEKIRQDGRIISSAVLIIQGLDSQGHRVILAIEPMIEESEASWKAVFDKLRKRGLQEVWLVISDGHKGIQAAVRKSFLGSAWQRCKVHFMRNLLHHIPHMDKKRFAKELKQIWLQNDLESAHKIASMLVDKYEDRFPEAIKCLLDGLEDSLQFYHFPAFDKRKISSTNTLERLNCEIRRRTRVVGIFPSVESYVRLVTTYVLENTEEWVVEKSYFSPGKILEMKSILKEQKQRLAA
ncbi:MAG: IS256 family transposase [Tissierellales bacterium]|nr:IS256 family transposase [Tissierellales bacterium]